MTDPLDNDPPADSEPPAAGQPDATSPHSAAPDATPPVSAEPPASAAPAPAADGTSPASTTPAPPGVTKRTLWWVGALVVLLAFVASFLGSTLANRSVEPLPAATVEVTVEPTPVAEPSDEARPPLTQEEIDALIPDSSIVRAGSGSPSTDMGRDGDLYINIDTADLYLHTGGTWTFVGNIKYSAVANLTGEQGETGAQGKPGEPGAAGEPGVAGTQIVLGKAEPSDTEPCGNDGDIFIDTVNAAVYVCTSDAWVPQQPQAQTQ